MAEPATDQTTDQATGDDTVDQIMDDVVGDDADQKTWLNDIPEGTFDERSQGILKRFGTVGDLAKGYMNAYNLVGRDKIPMPQTPEEWQEVYNRLGRPDDAAGYELSTREELPEEFKQLMSKNMDWFRMTAHELGLNSQQATELYRRYTDYIYDEAKSQNDQIESEMGEAVTVLKEELGESYDAKMILANRAITELGGEDLISLFERTGMGRNPTVVRAFIRMGELMSEEGPTDTTRDLGDTGDTSALDEEIASIQANPAYMDAKAPEHKILVEKMAKLMAKRHPEPKQPAGTIRLF